MRMFQPFAKTTYCNLVQEELEKAKLQLLAYQNNLEYAKAMVAYHRAVIEHLSAQQKESNLD